MIVKIFKAIESFKAIGYNFRKLLRGHAELLKVSGFEALGALQELRAEDYLNYLEAQSALNKNVRLPQFHAMISAPDHSYDKHKLNKLARDWMESMGYGEQPYLLIFHKDTDQAHIHIVSTRVKRNGEKVDSSFEYKRAIAELNRLMQLDEAHQAQLDVAKVMRYQCSTRAQLMMLLEGIGYRCADKDSKLILFKFGKPLFAVSEERINTHLAFWTSDKNRAAQLRAIIRKYQQVYDSTLVRETKDLPGGRKAETDRYHSALSDFMRKNFALEFVFHASGDKPPYGYTIIDHTKYRVFKGSEVMKLTEFISPKVAVEQTTTAMGQQQAATYFPPLQPYFGQDIDDQQIHGPRRRRQKKARNNTR